MLCSERTTSVTWSQFYWNHQITEQQGLAVHTPKMKLSWSWPSLWVCVSSVWLHPSLPLLQGLTDASTKGSQSAVWSAGLSLSVFPLLITDCLPAATLPLTLHPPAYWYTSPQDRLWVLLRKAIGLQGGLIQSTLGENTHHSSPTQDQSRKGPGRLYQLFLLAWWGSHCGPTGHWAA